MASTVPIQTELGRIDLPSDLAEAFRQVGDREDPPELLHEGLAIVGETLDEAGVDVSLDDMYQSEPTRHAVTIGESVEHVPCVLDALIVALTLDTDPVEIHSEPPGGGESVQFRVTGEDVTVTPESAVVSFGVGYVEDDDADITYAEEILNDESRTLTACSLLNAFPDSAAYSKWERNVAGAGVMELDVEAMVAIARQAA